MINEPASTLSNSTPATSPTTDDELCGLLNSLFDDAFGTFSPQYRVPGQPIGDYIRASSLPYRGEGAPALHLSIILNTKTAKSTEGPAPKWTLPWSASISLTKVPTHHTVDGKGGTLTEALVDIGVSFSDYDGAVDIAAKSHLREAAKGLLALSKVLALDPNEALASVAKEV